MQSTQQIQEIIYHKEWENNVQLVQTFFLLTSLMYQTGAEKHK